MANPVVVDLGLRDARCVVAPHRPPDLGECVHGGLRGRYFHQILGGSVPHQVLKSIVPNRLTLNKRFVVRRPVVSEEEQAKEVFLARRRAKSARSPSSVAARVLRRGGGGVQLGNMRPGQMGAVAAHVQRNRNSAADQYDVPSSADSPSDDVPGGRSSRMGRSNRNAQSMRDLAAAQVDLKPRDPRLTRGKRDSHSRVISGNPLPSSRENFGAPGYGVW